MGYDVQSSCPHLSGSSCRAMSRIAGREMMATGPMCQIHCRRDGPFNGREITNPTAFTIRIVKRANPDDFYVPSGAVIWGKMHRMAADANVGDEEMRKMIRGAAREFNATCACAEHWDRYLEIVPMGWTSLRERFAWTVKAHNQVNVRLRKPQLSIQKAAEIHSVRLYQLP